MQVFSCTVAYELLDLLVVIVINPTATGFSAGKVTAFTMHDVSASDSAILGSCVYPFSDGHLGNFKKDWDRFVVVEYELGIGRLAGVVPAEASAHTDDAGREALG